MRRDHFVGHIVILLVQHHHDDDQSLSWRRHCCCGHFCCASVLLGTGMRCHRNWMDGHLYKCAMAPGIQAENTMLWQNWRNTYFCARMSSISCISINLHQQDVFLSSMSYFVQNVFLCSNNNIVVFSKKLHSCPTTSINAANVQENFRSLGLQWVLSFVSTMSFEANRYNIIPISLASTFERFVECFLLVQKQNGNWIQNRAQMLKRFSVPSFSLPPVTWLLLCVNNSKNLTLDPTMKRLQGAGSKLWAFASGGCFLNPDTNNNSDTVAFNSLGGGR